MFTQVLLHPLGQGRLSSNQRLIDSLKALVAFPDHAADVQDADLGVAEVVLAKLDPGVAAENPGSQVGILLIEHGDVVHTNLPDHTDIVAIDFTVRCEDWQVLLLALGDQQPVKRVAMNWRQVVDAQGVAELDRK